MSKSFTLSNNMNDTLLKNVAKLKNFKDTEFEIKYINLNDLIRSKKNFYELSYIDELADSIKLSKLFHNILVRPLEDSKYEILSGERRFLAFNRLVEKGEDGYNSIPCQIINVDDIEAELIVIAANAYARELSDKDKLLQIQKLELLLVANKTSNEKGSRDIQKQISQILNMSKAAVGRYQNINKNLIPELRDKVDNEKLTITNANIFASLDENHQKVVLEILEERKLSKAEAQDLKEKLEKVPLSKAEPQDSNEKFEKVPLSKAEPQDSNEKFEETELELSYDNSNEDISTDVINSEIKQSEMINSIKEEFIKPKANLVHTKQFNLEDKLKKINKMILSLTKDLATKEIINFEEGKQLIPELQENLSTLISKMK